MCHPSWPLSKWKFRQIFEPCRELKKVSNMRLVVVTIVVDVPCTVPKGLTKRVGEREIRERIETTQTTTLLRSSRILKGVLETWGDLCSLWLQRMTTRNKYINMTFLVIEKKTKIEAFKKVLLSNIHSSISYRSFVLSSLNGSKYCCPSLIVPFSINLLFCPH